RTPRVRATEAAHPQHEADGVAPPRQIQRLTNVGVVNLVTEPPTARTGGAGRDGMGHEANSFVVDTYQRDGKVGGGMRGSKRGASEERLCPHSLHLLLDKCGRAHCRP